MAVQSGHEIIGQVEVSVRRHRLELTADEDRATSTARIGNPTHLRPDAEELLGAVDVAPGEAECLVSTQTEARHERDGERSRVPGLLDGVEEEIDALGAQVLRPWRGDAGPWHAIDGAGGQQLVVDRVSECRRQEGMAVANRVGLATSGLLLHAAVLDHGQPILDGAGGEASEGERLEVGEVEPVEAEVRPHRARCHLEPPRGEPGGEPIADRELVFQVGFWSGDAHGSATVGLPSRRQCVSVCRLPEGLAALRPTPGGSNHI